MNIGYIFDFILWTLVPVFLTITFGWIVFCISRIKQSYSTWRYHIRNNFADSDYNLYNSRNNLIRNVLLLCIVLSEFGIGFTVLLIQTCFAPKWALNHENITVSSNCTLDRTSWLYDFSSVSAANWFLEGLRQSIYIIELAFYRLTIHHLIFAYRKHIYPLKIFSKYLITTIILSLLVLVLSSLSITYTIGFGLSLIIIQFLCIQCYRDSRELHLVVSRAVSDEEYENGIKSSIKLKNNLKRNRKVFFILAAVFQVYLVSLYLYFVVVLVTQTFLENSCWITEKFHIQIPKVQFDETVFSKVCNVIWIFRTITAVSVSAILSLMSLLYFCSVVFGRIMVEFRVRTNYLCKHHLKQQLIV